MDTSGILISIVIVGGLIFLIHTVKRKIHYLGGSYEKQNEKCYGHGIGDGDVLFINGGCRCRRTRLCQEM